MIKYDNLPLCAKHNSKINAIANVDAICRLQCPSCIGPSTPSIILFNIDTLKYFDQWTRNCIQILDNTCRSMLSHQQLSALQMSSKFTSFLNHSPSQCLHIVLFAFEEQIKILQSNIAYISQHSQFTDLTHPMFLMDIYKIIHQHTQPTINLLQQNLLHSFNSYIRKNNPSFSLMESNDINLCKTLKQNLAKNKKELDKVYFDKIIVNKSNEIQIKQMKKPALQINLGQINCIGSDSNVLDLNFNKKKHNQSLLTPQKINSNIERSLTSRSKKNSDQINFTFKKWTQQSQKSKSDVGGSNEECLEYIIGKMEDQLSSLILIKAGLDAQEQIISGYVSKMETQQRISSFEQNDAQYVSKQ